MAENDIDIRIGAQVDHGLDVALRGVEESARRSTDRAAKAVEQSSGRMQRSASRAEVAFRKLANELEHGTKFDDRIRRTTNAVVQFGEQATSNFDKVRARFDLLARDAERASDRIERAEKKGLGGRFAGLQTGKFDPVRAAAGLGVRAFGAAVGVGRDLARGAGLETDVGSHVRRAISLERMSVDLANAAYIPGGKGAAAVRQDPRKLVQEAFNVANANAYDPEKALEGLSKFVAKTGDLETGRDVIGSMARLAKATGAELDDMVDASADVSNALGPIPDKGRAIDAVMRSIAMQGKLGAVEIKDLATQMAKVAAASGQFGTDRANSVVEFGALAQMSRRGGGSASATQAATSVMSLAAQFGKGARIGHFRQFGVELDDAAGRRRNIRDIVVDTVAAAGARARDPKTGKFSQTQFDLVLGKMIADQQAKRAVRDVAQTYIEAGGGEKGIAAMQRSFDELTRNTLSNADVMRAHGLAMQTTESQVQLFNNQLTQASMGLKEQLVPAMAALVPILIQATAAFASAISLITGKSAGKVEAPTLPSEAVGAMAQLDREAKGGAVGKKTWENANVANQALQESIAQQQKSLEEKKKPGYLAAGAEFLSIPHRAILEAAFGTGRAPTDEEKKRGFVSAGGDFDLKAERERRIAQDEKNLERQMKQQEEMGKKLDEINRRFDTGLKIIEMPKVDPKPTAPTPADAGHGE